MEQRGRKSADALALQQIVGTTAVPRPDAPYDLTDEQVEIWRAVVDSMPADWFGRETQDMLAQYCRHVVAARHVASMIRELETAVAKDAAAEGAEKTTILLSAAGALDTLLKMQEREGRAMSSLATRMRLTQQTLYSAKKGREGRVNKKPWES